MYVPIHIHSDHSRLDGIATVEEIAKQASILKCPAITLTDHGDTTGLYPFQKACEKYGVKPILGAELYLNDDRDIEFEKDKQKLEIKNDNKHIVVLVKNEIGWRNFCYLVTESNSDGFYKRPRTTSDLIFRNKEGLIITSACIEGILAKPYLKKTKKETEIRRYAKEFKKHFKDDFYIEIQINEMEEQHQANDFLLNLSEDLGIKVILGLDSHYVYKNHVELQDMFLMMQTKKKEDEFKGFTTRNLYLKSEKMIYKENEEFEYNYSDSEIKGWLDNSLEIADKCNFKIKNYGFQFPHFLDSRNDEVKFLQNLVYDKFDKLLSEDKLISKGKTFEDYNNRLNYELDVIVSKGFTPYFLVLYDIVKYCFENNIWTGPGRGSAAGSLVSYLLGITKVDPLKFDLYFERFLDPEKTDMPDIDVDFEKVYKENVESYIIQKYGKDNVCKIIAFSTLGIKGILENCSRLLNLKSDIVSDLYKLRAALPPDVDTYEKFIWFVEDNEKFTHLLDDSDAMRVFHFVEKLLDRISNYTVHAAGLIIAPKPLYNYIPLQRAKDKDSESEARMLSTLTEGTERKDVSEIGLLKMDILGLTTLSVIKDTIDLIYQTYKIDYGYLQDLNLNDDNIYRYINNGKTQGTFQMESNLMNQVIKLVKPTTFEDLVAINALCRPATLATGQHEIFAENKHSKDEIKGIAAISQDIYESLKETYGILVYQEQVLTILNKIGLFTMPEGNKARKLMVKGLANTDDLDKMMNKFIDGAVSQGYDEDDAFEIWRVLKEFCSYSFNKSHAVSYAIIFFQTIFLKFYYYAEFMSMLLTYTPTNKGITEDESKFSKYVKVLNNDGFMVLPVDINLSKDKCLPTDKNSKQIRLFFNILKGIGDKAIKELIKHQPYESLFDLINKTSGRVVNKKIIEILITCGAFDSIYKNRKGLCDSFKEIFELKPAQRNKKEIIEQIIESNKNIRDFTKEELQKIELEYYGFYVSGHPFIEKLKIINEINQTKSKKDRISLPSNFSKNKGTICGQVTEISQNRRTSNNGTMRFYTLSDHIKSIKLIMFDSHINKYSSLFKKGEIIAFNYSYNEKYNSFTIIDDLDTPNKLELFGEHYDEDDEYIDDSEIPF